MNARHRLIRVDTDQRREKIESAQRMIFDGVNITNRNIEFFLQDESLVPTRVCLYYWKFMMSYHPRTECFLRKAF